MNADLIAAVLVVIVLAVLYSALSVERSVNR